MHFIPIRRLGFLVLLLPNILFINASDSLTLATIYREHQFSPQKVSGYVSMNDGKHFTVIEKSREIVRYDYETGQESEVLFSVDWFNMPELIMISDYSFSQDEQSILLVTRKEMLYRYSYFSRHFIYNIAKKEVTPLYNASPQRLATFSPDGKKVAFVVDNNLLVKNLASGAISRITLDGALNEIINGASDWVYEEEFALKRAYAWSPDSRKIAYYKFDESNVREYSFPVYNDLYPEQYTYKYPKAGEGNAIVDLFVYNLATGENVKMETGQDPERYLPRIFWLPESDRVCVIHLNRRQNHLKLLACNASDGKAQILYEEEDDRYISEVDDEFVTFLNQTENFIVKSEIDGYMHLYLYDLDGKLIRQLTKGEWEVTELIGVDQENGKVYYQSNEVSPLGRQIYCVSLEGDESEIITTISGTHSAQFSSDFSYYLHTYSNANTPPSYAIRKSNGDLVREIETNEKVQENMRKYGFTDKNFFSFENKTGHKLYGYTVLPPDFNPESKYPVLIYTYGGPSVQLVKDAWNSRLPWFQHLAAQGYIVACLDNRGSEARGEEFQKYTYLQLGKYETEDQIELVKYLRSKGYVDKDRIGIFGWSYGGYLSLLCMTKGHEYFSMGIAVAPVTNWRFYDTIYTERYMRKPEENSEGYDENSPMTHADKLKGKLLLIHGTADDNVHFQNAVEMVKTLISNDKEFDSEFYPNKNHGISGGNTTYHLYNRMTDYILENL